MWITAHDIEELRKALGARELCAKIRARRAILEEADRRLAEDRKAADGDLGKLAAAYGRHWQAVSGQDGKGPNGGA